MEIETKRKLFGNQYKNQKDSVEAKSAPLQCKESLLGIFENSEQKECHFEQAKAD